MINPIFKSVLWVGMVCLWGCKDYDLVAPEYVVFEIPQGISGNYTSYQDAIQTMDGGYTAVGANLNLASSSIEALLVKTNRKLDGIVLTSNYTNNSQATSVIEASNNALFIGGQHNTFGLLLKRDAILGTLYSGFIQNAVPTLGFNTSKIDDIAMAPDGQIIALVSVQIMEAWSLFIVNFRDTGKELLHDGPIPVALPTGYVLDDLESKRSICVAPNNKIFIACTLKNSQRSVGFLGQIDMASSPTQTYRIYVDTTSNTILRDVAVSPVGHCYAVGYKSDTTTTSGFLINSSINTTWQERDFVIPSVQIVASALCVLKDGNLAIAGQTTENGATQMWLSKINAQTGNPCWNKKYGKGSDSASNSVFQTTDGGFLIAGYSISLNGISEAYLVKTDTEGNSQ